MKYLFANRIFIPFISRILLYIFVVYLINPSLGEKIIEIRASPLAVTTEHAVTKEVMH